MVRWLVQCLPVSGEAWHWHSSICPAMGADPSNISVMVFASAAMPTFLWTCAGHPVQCCDSAKYLGLVLDSQGILQSFESLHHKMVAAWAQLRKQFAGLRCAMSLSLLLHVYHVCVPPVASYACELWGVRYLPTALRAPRAQLEHSHARILRTIAGLRATIPASIVFSEVGSQPLHHSWLGRSVSVWNGLARQPPSSLYHQLALDDCRDAILHNVKNYSYSHMQELRMLRYPFALRCDALDTVDLGCVRELLSRRLQQPFQNLDVSPRTCPSPRAMLCTYACWFARPSMAPASCPRHAAQIRVSASALRVFCVSALAGMNSPVIWVAVPGSPACNVFAQSVLLERLVMSTIWCLLCCPMRP